MGKKSKPWPLNIVILGPQGSGKGTQAALLKKKFNLEHIEIGDILRDEVRKKSPLGKKIEKIIEKGRLVPFEIIVKITKEKLKKIPKNKGIVFDGTPRRREEIKPLEENLKKIGRKIDYVFLIDIPKEETIKRLAKRRVCEKCNKLFILGVNIKKSQKKCPSCGGKVFQRDDDKPKAIELRLKLYRKRTTPVIDYYKKKNLLIKIDGRQPIEKVFKEIVAHICQSRKN